MMRTAAWVLAAGTAGMLAGCTVGPDFQAPKAEQARIWPQPPQPGVPAEPSVPVPSAIDPRWWTLFGDAELTSLEVRLAGANLDLQQYAERLEQSRAQLRVARADALPSLNSNGSYTRERPSSKGVVSLFSGGSSTSFASQGDVASGAEGTNGGIPAQTTIQPFNLFQYGFDASWEVDLFGHARREVEAARAGAVAAVENARGALVSAEAELARDYIQLRGLQQRIALLRQDVGTLEDSSRLTRERAKFGLAPQFDAIDAETELRSTGSSLPNLLAQQTQMLNAIGLLLGEQPGGVDAELAAAQPVPVVPPAVPVGLPSELARRRPDIRAAEAQLHAATAEVGVAVADFYPKITLSGSIGLQALLAKDLGNWASRQYGLGPTIELPIFQGGRLRATLALRKAEQREAAISYRKTVLQALGDVNNALAAYAQEQHRLAELDEAYRLSQQAEGLANLRYRQGIASYIDVLDAERQRINIENQVTDSGTSVSSDLVALYKALGGGWSA